MKLRLAMPLLVVVLVGLTGCLSMDVAMLINPPLTERELEPAEGFTSNRILLLDLNGFVTSEAEGTFGKVNTCSPDFVRAVLKQAENDHRIKALVLRIDSPGGEVTASDLIYHELRAFRERRGIPVIASVMGMGTSGAYYIACAGDEIYVHPTSIVGSIGVIAFFPNLEGLANKIGYEHTVIKSGDLKDMTDPLKPMKPEVRTILQQTIDSMYERFVEVVAAGRPGLGGAENVRKLADGRIYTPQQAVKHRLVDGVCYLPDAIAAAKKAAGIRDARVVTYAYSQRRDLTIYSPAAAAKGLDFKLVDLNVDHLAGLTRAGFYYLWQPNGID